MINPVPADRDITPAPATITDETGLDDPAMDRVEAALDRVTGLRAEYDREWQQFVVWAIAHGHRALPASTDTLLAYLLAYPGTLATQRGRVTAIAAAHRYARRAPDDPRPITAGRPARVGLPSPAEAEPVRQLLRPPEPATATGRAREGRAHRLRRARAELEPVIAALPATRWPEGLTGRRDALVLHLIGAGLAFDTIAALRQRDLVVTDDQVVIGSQPLVVLPATGMPASCPVAVTRRWAQILAHAPTPTGHIALHDLLTHARPDSPEPDAQLLARWRDLPLLTRFDEAGFADGYIDDLAPITRAEVIDILTHRQTFTPPAAVGELDPGWWERGIASRHHQVAVGRDLDDMLTRLEDMLDDLGDFDDWTDPTTHPSRAHPVHVVEPEPPAHNLDDEITDEHVAHRPGPVVSTDPAPVSVHQLHISLLGVTPKVWRRIHLRSSATLAELHTVIQITMGWENFHLHRFEGPSGADVADHTPVATLPPGHTLGYLYDFGDQWAHLVRVEKILTRPDTTTTARVLAGACACPPEDSGGPPGYAAMLASLKTRTGWQYQQHLDMYGTARFDPTRFEIDETNHELARWIDASIGDPSL